ncbi:cell surface glycoprotein 1-like [Paramacrobiotus metropolitanus]|uniref:cell surface glycoprotein 1-like n=1 Tax=Paramacrobiotus metropolitanus TaxID=2943436 RepID=UPI002445EAC5|nr:cell surface glycoprotein 1-like [Paramacrobiotus metropolitanus]
MTDEQQTQTAQKIHATIQDRDKVLRRLVTLRCGKQELRQLPLDPTMIQTIQRLRNPSINPGAYTLEIQPRPGEEVTEKIPITMLDSSEDEENADNVDSDDSTQQKAAAPPKGSTPERGRSPKKPVKPEAKETTKPKSDSTVKTPKPNPAKRHKSSDDLDISDAGPQRTEQKEKAQQPHDKDAVERKFKEVMERTGTKPAKTSGGRLRNPPKPPTPIEQPQPSTSKQQSDVESDQISDIEEKDSISDHGEGDPYEGFKGDLKEMFDHGADTDESQWPAPDDARERLPDEQPDDPVDTLIRTVRVHVEIVRSIENARKNGVDIYQSLVRDLSNNIQEETEDDDDDDFQTPGNGSPKDDDDDDDENGKPPPPSNPAPQQQGEPEIPDRQPEEKDSSDKAEESKGNEDDGGVYIPRQYGKRIPITPDTDERPLLSEWNEDTMEVLPDDIPPLTNVRVKYTGIKSASKPKPSVSEYDA